jgi:hypothetical protein
LPCTNSNLSPSLLLLTGHGTRTKKSLICWPQAFCGYALGAIRRPLAAETKLALASSARSA